MREWGQKPRVELLPSPPPALLRMEETLAEPVVDDTGQMSVNESRQARAAAKLLSIKGAAKDLAVPGSGINTESEADTKRRKLLEKLAKLKAEATSTRPSTTATETTPPLDTTAEIVKGRGMRSIVRARIQLKIKLESEKATFRHNVNESKAQELRRRLLEAKAKREAEETDLTLKRLDMIDRRRELRRRLMVVKMMAAETESERRARELREKLMARKQATAAAGAGLRGEVLPPAVVA